MTEIRRRVRARCSDCGAMCYFDADNEPANPVCPECREMYDAEFAEYIAEYQDLNEEEGDA
jgi:hypothetical protein